MDPQQTPSARPVRHRRLNRRCWSALGGSFGQRHAKKLFTADIKRQLKQWLVERSENPYPTRAEKKALAERTGLTYTQVCNWFANWRRKLKNTGEVEEEERRDIDRRTWDHLIRTYNDHAKGNVEQLPWDEEEDAWSRSSCAEEGRGGGGGVGDGQEKDWNNNDSHCASTEDQRNAWTNGGDQRRGDEPPLTQKGNHGDLHQKQKKYKKHLMEKYFQDSGSDSGLTSTESKTSAEGDEEMEEQLGSVQGPPQLIKWIQSTAKFTPAKSHYPVTTWAKGREMDTDSDGLQHEELEAAEALARMAWN